MPSRRVGHSAHGDVSMIGEGAFEVLGWGGRSGSCCGRGAGGTRGRWRTGRDSAGKATRRRSGGCKCSLVGRDGGLGRGRA